MISGDDLELGAPGQEVLPRKVSEVDNLRVVGAGLLRLVVARGRGRPARGFGAP